MDADKQVRLDVLGFLHPLVQGYKKVCIPRQVRPHGVSAHRAFVDAVAQFVRHAEHHVLLPRTGGADCARVFTPVAGVQRDDDQAVGLAGWGVGGSFRFLRRI